MQVIIANQLVDGDVVFRAASGAWVTDIGHAALLADGVEAAQQAALADAAANLVVDPLPIEVARDGDRVVPVRLRERIRAFGPTAGVMPAIAGAAD